ncbi:MAG: hypothetical protein AABW47_01245 [Nanoarchaeota archaeon]
MKTNTPEETEEIKRIFEKITNIQSEVNLLHETEFSPRTSPRIRLKEFRQVITMELPTYLTTKPEDDLINPDKMTIEYLGKVKTIETATAEGGIIMSKGALIYIINEVGKNYDGDLQGIDFSLPITIPKNKCTCLEAI